MCVFSWLLFTADGPRFQSPSEDQPVLQYMVGHRDGTWCLTVSAGLWMPLGISHLPGTQQRLLLLLLQVGGEKCQEQPWPSCCCLQKAQPSSEGGVRVVGAVHTLCMGSSTEQRLLWALGGDCSLLSLPASCLAALGQSQAAAPAGVGSWLPPAIAGGGGCWGS